MTDQPRDAAVESLITRLIPIAQQHELTRRDVQLWLEAPTTYFRDEGTPLDHLDDPDLVADIAARSWGAVW